MCRADPVAVKMARPPPPDFSAFGTFPRNSLQRGQSTFQHDLAALQTSQTIPNGIEPMLGRGFEQSAHYASVNFGHGRLLPPVYSSQLASGLAMNSTFPRDMVSNRAVVGAGQHLLWHSRANTSQQPFFDVAEFPYGDQHGDNGVLQSFNGGIDAATEQKCDQYYSFGGQVRGSSFNPRFAIPRNHHPSTMRTQTQTGKYSRQSCKRPQKEPSKGPVGGGSATVVLPKSPKHDIELENAREELRKLGATLPGESPEEISRWVAARIANWPSRANVEKKQQEEHARKERGQLSKSASTPSLKENICRHRGSSARQRGSINRMSSLSADNAQSRDTDATVRDGSLKLLALQYAEASSCDESDPAGSATRSRAGSDHLNAEKPEERKCPSRNRRKVHRGISKKGKRPEKRRQSNPQDVGPPRRESLLRKLLEPTIREEQNVLLQCLRVLVRENFFMGCSKSGADT